MGNRPNPTPDDIDKAGFVFGREGELWTLRRKGHLHAYSYDRANVETVARTMWRRMVLNGEIMV